MFSAQTPTIYLCNVIQSDQAESTRKRDACPYCIPLFRQIHSRHRLHHPHKSVRRGTQGRKSISKLYVPRAHSISHNLLSTCCGLSIVIRVRYLCTDGVLELRGFLVVCCDPRGNRPKHSPLFNSVATSVWQGPYNARMLQATARWSGWGDAVQVSSPLAICRIIRHGLDMFVLGVQPQQDCFILPSLVLGLLRCDASLTCPVNESCGGE